MIINVTLLFDAGYLSSGRICSRWPATDTARRQIGNRTQPFESWHQFQWPWVTSNPDFKVTITGSALALHCCNAHAKINTKIENSTPCKIVTHEDFNLKLGTRDYVADITHHATLGSNRPSGGFPPNRGNITPVSLFWLYCFFSLDPAPRSNRRIDCYAEWLKWRVSAQGRSFWGSGRWVTSYRENIPQKLPKKGRE